MIPISEFKAIYNPYTRQLLVRYGKSLIEHTFEDLEEWVIINYDDNPDQPYFLHVQLDYDEMMQLLFYPRTDGDDSLNENLGSYYNSPDVTSENICIVHNDYEWDNNLINFLLTDRVEHEFWKKIRY